MLVRSTRALIVLALALLVLPAHAADPAAAAAPAGNLIGVWTITGPGLDGVKTTLEFAAPNRLTIVQFPKTGEVSSRGLAPDWKLAGKQLAFTGSMYANDFEIRGAWTLAWGGPDKLAATTGEGKKYMLERGAAARAADPPAAKAAPKPAERPVEKPADKPAGNAAVGNLIGAWTVTGPGIVANEKMTMAFDAPDRLMVHRYKTRNTGTLSGGPPWKLKGAKLAFADTLAEDDFEIAGTWTLAWDGPGKVTATTAKGKTYHLARAEPDKPATAPAAKPADHAPAKPAGPGDPVGTWTITGPGLDGVRATLEFAMPDALALVRVGRYKNGDVHSRSTGPTWKLAGDTLAFHGSLAADDFKIKGDWALAWDGPDKFTATTGRGKTYHLERVKAK